MRSLVLGLVTTIAISGVASAADMANSLDTALFDWSGWYVGAHIGAGAGNEDWTLLDNPGDGESGSIGEVVTEHDVNGLLGGVQAGMNWQTGSLVLGGEVELALAGIGGDSSRYSDGDKPGPREWSTEMNWLATLGPRLGYAADRILFYVEGGLAVGGADLYHLGAKGGVPPGTGSEREYFGSDVRFGSFVGAGAEFAFADTMSARVEYNFANFASDEAELHGEPTDPAVFGIDQTLHVVKVGLNFHF